MATPRIIKVKTPGNFQRIAYAVVARHVEKRMRLAMQYLASEIRLTLNTGQPVKRGTGGRVGLGPSKPGQPPHKLTGRLQRSTRGLVERGGRGSGRIRGIIAMNTEYARALELGFQGFVIVPAHVRKVNKVFGRPLGYTAYAYVPTHRRYMNLRRRPYIRPTLLKKRYAMAEIIRLGR